MTREHRLVISLDEIRAVRWQCPQCRAALTFDLAKPVQLPKACPNCHDPIGPNDDFTRATDAARAFVNALKSASATAPQLLQLEFVEPESTATRPTRSP